MAKSDIVLDSLLLDSIRLRKKKTTKTIQEEVNYIQKQIDNLRIG